ncbi:MAG: hypothetical protein HY681_06070 [Chloroflexi bacterium]|nr:hypothetical protein [Chloroflexota bacterium]
MIRRRFTTHSLLQEAAALKIELANAPSIERYLHEYPDLLRIVSHTLRDSRGALPSAAMRLEIEGDPREIGGRTLVLRILQQVDSALSESLQAWNDRIAQVLRYSDGWFHVSLDLRSGASLQA